MFMVKQFPTTDQNKQFKDGHWSFLEVIINHNKSQYSDSDPPAPIKLGPQTHIMSCVCLPVSEFAEKKLDCLCRWFRVKLVLSNELNAAFGH